MSRYDLVSIITCYQLEILWKLKLARGRLIRGWKGIRKNGGGRKWINVSLLLYDGKMWRDRGKHCPIEYSQFCSSRLARTSNDLFHDFSSMNELINKCFRRKPFSYRIVSWPIIISIDIHSISRFRSFGVFYRNDCCRYLRRSVYPILSHRHYRRILPVKRNCQREL